jgi:hypothetical protein
MPFEESPQERPATSAGLSICRSAKEPSTSAPAGLTNKAKAFTGSARTRHLHTPAQNEEAGQQRGASGAPWCAKIRARRVLLWSPVRGRVRLDEFAAVDLETSGELVSL